MIYDSKGTIPRSNSSTRSFWPIVPNMSSQRNPERATTGAKKSHFPGVSAWITGWFPLPTVIDAEIGQWKHDHLHLRMALRANPPSRIHEKNRLRGCIVSNLIHIAITWQKLKYPARFETSMGSHKTSSAGVSAGAASSIIRSSYHLPEEVLPRWWCCYRGRAKPCTTLVHIKIDVIFGWLWWLSTWKWYSEWFIAT